MPRFRCRARPLCLRLRSRGGRSRQPLIAIAWSGRGAALLDRIAAVSGLFWWLALALVAAGSLAFVDLEALVVAPLIAGVVLAVVVVLLWRAGFGERIALGTRAGRFADLALVVLLLLAVPNLVVFDLRRSRW